MNPSLCQQVYWCKMEWLSLSQSGNYALNPSYVRSILFRDTGTIVFR